MYNAWMLKGRWILLPHSLVLNPAGSSTLQKGSAKFKCWYSAILKFCRCLLGIRVSWQTESLLWFPEEHKNKKLPKLLPVQFGTRFNSISVQAKKQFNKVWHDFFSCYKLDLGSKKKIFHKKLNEIKKIIFPFLSANIFKKTSSTAPAAASSTSRCLNRKKRQKSWRNICGFEKSGEKKNEAPRGDEKSRNNWSRNFQLSRMSRVRIPVIWAPINSYAIVRSRQTGV